MNYYELIRKLAKETYSQNIFTASKEIYGIRLFKNKYNLSKIQQIYLSYLYFYDNINKDLIIEKISKHIFDSDIYEDAYMLYKRERKIINQEDNKKHDVKLVMGKEIKFPSKENKT